MNTLMIVNLLSLYLANSDYNVVPTNFSIIFAIAILPPSGASLLSIAVCVCVCGHDQFSRLPIQAGAEQATNPLPFPDTPT